MTWSVDGNSWGGDNSICRFVQLPNNTTETLTTYTGGRVTARLEKADKELATSADFDTWLSCMDKVYNCYKDLTGYTPYNSRKIEMKSTRDNLNDYMGITDGNNYWWVVFGYYTGGSTVFKHAKAFYQGHMRRLSQDDWGDTPMHELSHVFDNYKWNFDSETLAQLKLYYVIEQLNAEVYRSDRYGNSSNGWYTKSNYYDLLKHDRFMDSYDASFVNGRYASEGFASILIDIQKAIDWNPFKKTFRYFSSLSKSMSSGEKLKLFLTKLKDYSGVDVLSYINNRDKRIIESHFDITLEYVEPVYPAVSGGGSKSEINADKGKYSVFEFTPTESANYYIYTSPYAGSGVSNDTYIEVYTNASLSGIPIASNDDYDGGRFSKVSIAATAGTTYYIKIRHYASGQLHAELNITKDAPVQLLTLDEPQDIITSSGEFALFSFTPTVTCAYNFEVGNYNGGTSKDNTYIKLYDNISMTYRLGNGEKKIIANLKAGHTYYLQFSGFLMKYTRGRVSVKQGQTLEFKKKTGGSYIYVNNPEKFIEIYPTNMQHVSNSLIYRQTNVYGTNTMYVTHSCSDYENHPTDEFYYDIDFENNTNSNVTISIDKLNYLVTKDYGELSELCYDRLSNNSEYSGTYTIPAKSHILLFKDIMGQALKMPVRNDNYYCLLGIFLDFRVLGNKNIAINTLAAYDERYLQLTTSSDGILYANSNTKISNWNFVTYTGLKRIGERDINKKMKGVDRTGLAEINAELNIALDDSMPAQTLPIYMVDRLYGDRIHNPKYTWITAINPWNDIDWGVYYALPSAMNGFEYDDTHNGKTGKWYFDFSRLNPNVFNDIQRSRYSNSLSDGELNNSINNTFVNYFKHQASIDRPINPSSSYPLPNAVSKEQWQEVAMMMGEWGTTYTYDIYVQNNGDFDRQLKYMLRMSNYVAVKLRVENLSTKATQNSLRTVESDKVNGNFIRREHELFNLNIEKHGNYHITISILNGVGITGFDNWIEIM